MEPANITGNFTLQIERLSKCFGRRQICRDVVLQLPSTHSLAITGPNGSGKSTMVKLIAGLIRPDAGTVRHMLNGGAIKPEDWYRHIGLVSPDLALYDELTALENLQFASEVGDVRKSRDDFDLLLEQVGLDGRGEDRVAAYSSGMKQRLKFAVALLKEPALLLLDEPTMNLDEDGARRIWEAVARRRMTLIVATNDPSEAERCQRRLVMGSEEVLGHHA